jgi:hypothetical protein
MPEMSDREFVEWFQREFDHVAIKGQCGTPTDPGRKVVWITEGDYERLVALAGKPTHDWDVSYCDLASLRLDLADSKALLNKQAAQIADLAQDCEAIESNLNAANTELTAISALIGVEWDSGFSPEAVTKYVTKHLASEKARADALEKERDHLADKMERALIAVAHFTHRYNEDCAKLQALELVLGQVREEVEKASHNPCCQQLFPVHSVCGHPTASRAHYAACDADYVPKAEITIASAQVERGGKK